MIFRESLRKLRLRKGNCMADLSQKEIDSIVKDANLYHHMESVAKANGYSSLTDAIVKADQRKDAYIAGYIRASNLNFYTQQEALDSAREDWITYRCTKDSVQVDQNHD